MSWGLYNHNYKFAGELPGLVPDGSEISTNNLFAGDEDYVNSMIFKGNLFAAGTNGKIMLTEKGHSHIQISLNGGETWEEKLGAMTANTDHIVSDIRYDQAQDVWYLSQGAYSSNRNMDIYYSDDDGDTWTILDSGTPAEFGFNWTMYLAPDGKISTAGKLTNGDCQHIQYSDPPYSATKQTSSLGEVWTGQYSIAAVGDRPIFSWSAQNRLVIVDAGLSTSSFHNALVTESPWASKGDTFILATGQTSVNDVDFFRIEPTDTPPFDNFTISFSGSPDGVGAFYADDTYLLTGALGTNLWLEASRTGNTDSFDGDYTATLSAAKDSGGYRVEYAGEGYWYVGYRSASRVRLDKFYLGSFGFAIPSSGSLEDEIKRQTPDIFYKMDDTGSPSTVVDIGSKQYVNTVGGTITFEQEGLVRDGGTAALFGGSVQIASMPHSVDDVHVWILSHDNTASARTLLSTGTTADQGYVVELTTDHKVQVTDSEGGTIITTALTADVATLVIVAIHDDIVEVYIEGASEAIDDMTLAAPDDARQILGAKWDGSAFTAEADGVTIDYYAQIPYENADIAAIQEAWGVTPTAPDAPVPSDIGNVRMVVRANTTPSLISLYDDRLKQWRQVYNIGNEVASSGRVTVWEEGGTNVDLTDGKFGGSMSIAYNSPRSHYLPLKAPIWDGFHGLSLANRDFTLQGWIKPGRSNGFCYFVSSQAQKEQGGIWYRYAGLTVVLSGTAATQGQMSLYVGKTLSAALSGDGQSDALTIHWRDFPTFNEAAYNFVTICRRNNQWYGTIAGKFPASRVVNGNLSAPVVMDPSWYGMMFGTFLKPYKKLVSGGLIIGYSGGPINPDYEWGLAAYSEAVNIDDPVFIIDEALYTQEFTPPTAAFVL